MSKEYIIYNGINGFRAKQVEASIIVAVEAARRHVIPLSYGLRSCGVLLNSLLLIEASAYRVLLRVEL